MQIVIERRVFLLELDAVEAKKIFRPQVSYYLERDSSIWFVLVAIGFGVLALSQFVQRGSLTVVFALLILAIPPACVGILGMLKLLRSYIAIDKEGFRGQVNRESFAALWRDVVTAEFKAYLLNPRINLFTKQTRLSIPVINFEFEQVWHECKEHLSPESLTEAGMKQVNDYKEWLNKDHQTIQDSTISLKIDLRKMRMIGLISVAFWVWMMIVLLLNTSSIDPLVSLACSGIFILMALSLIAAGGTIKMNSQQIIYSSWFGTYAMKWDEITQLELDQPEKNFVFANAYKLLPIVGIGFWSGKDKSAMLDYMGKQIMVRNIPIEVSLRASFCLPKNTRVTNSR